MGTLNRLFPLKFRTSIGWRLIRTSLLIALIPALIIAFVSVKGGLNDGQRQVQSQLESVATLKEAEINTWVGDLISVLKAVLIDKELASNAHLLLRSQSNLPSQSVHNFLQEHLNQIVENNDYFEELFFVNLQGKVILSTNSARVGQYYTGQIFFQHGLREPYIRPLSYPVQAGHDTVIVVVPVWDTSGQSLGVLGGRASTLILNQIMSERAGLGQTGETYLVGRNHMMLTEPQLTKGLSTTSNYVFSQGADAALATGKNGTGVYQNYHGSNVIGVYHWLPDLEVALLAEQASSEAFRGIYNTLRIDLAVAILAILIAAVASLSFTRSIANPLAHLANTAELITGGDLDRTIPIDRTDEIGKLAQAFNTMTAQLRGLIGGLERRVEERTLALQRANTMVEHRALQLETVARLSQEITSILKIEELLNRVVVLIQEAFGYYCVNIFLRDPEQDLLILQATGCRESRVRVHRYLPVDGHSLNSKAILLNQVILVNDVTQEPEFLQDDGLSETCSEVIIPLRARGQIIGTLDIQSSEVNAFTQEDGLVLQSLGNQVAIAIENASLYEDSRKVAVLEERTRLARELHDSITQALFGLDLRAKALKTYFRKDPARAEEQVQEIRRITREMLQEMRSLILELRPGLIDQIGLIPALKRLMESSQKETTAEFLFDVIGEPKFTREMERGLFRIAQEAVNNAVHHAQARWIKVYLRSEDGHASLLVQDDGIGFDPNAPPNNGSSFGLIGMRERAKLMGARLEVESQPGLGTRVEVRLPAVR